MLQKKRILPNNAVTAILNPFGYSLVEEHFQLKKQSKPNGEATEEARANVPPELEKDDWNCLVDLWSKQDYMIPLKIIYYQIYSYLLSCGFVGLWD